jgi:hypothetical protein
MKSIFTSDANVNKSVKEEGANRASGKNEVQETSCGKRKNLSFGFLKSTRTHGVFKYVCVAAIVIAASWFVTSCSHEYNTNVISPPDSEYQFLNKKFKIPTGKYIWEAQLDKAIEHNYLMQDSELKLEKYSYVRKVKDMNDFKNIKSDLINNDAVFPIYDDLSGNFVVQKVEDKEFYQFIMNDLLPTSPKAIESANDYAYIFEMNDLGLVDLKWHYKGESFNTICLVSDKKGVIYDNLFNFIVYVIDETRVTEPEKENKIPRLKSGTESSNCGNKTSFSYNFHKNKSGGSLFTTKWEIIIDMTIDGACSNGQKSITNFHPSTSYWYQSGYTCSVGLSTISIAMGTNGHIHFAWGWCGGSTASSSSVSLSWGGFGYTISGGSGSGKGETGEAYISPSDLN